MLAVAAFWKETFDGFAGPALIAVVVWKDRKDNRY
jgi:hypothetical protein